MSSGDGYPYDIPRWSPQQEMRPVTVDRGAKCQWCGKTFEEHQAEPGQVTPRVPCLGLRKGFLPAATAGNARLAQPYDIDHIYRYHAPTPEKVPVYVRLREAAAALATQIVNECPDSRERSVALTHLETAVMWANASIARS